MGSDEAFDSTYVGCPDVAIYKYSDHDQVGAGNEIGFFVDLENFGDGPANQVTVSDPLPSGVGVSWSIDSGNSTSGWTISGTPPTQTLVYGPTSLSGNDLAYAHVVSGTTIDSCGPYPNMASFATANAGSGSASASASVVGCPPPFRTLGDRRGLRRRDRHQRAGRNVLPAELHRPVHGRHVGLAHRDPGPRLEVHGLVRGLFRQRDLRPRDDGGPLGHGDLLPTVTVRRAAGDRSDAREGEGEDRQGSLQGREDHETSSDEQEEGPRPRAEAQAG
jgi:uncharacterized repeat protein (TIGR01451 family)